MKRKVIAALLELAGIGSVSVAGFTVATALGWLVVGIGLIMFGLATERVAKPVPDRGDG